MSDLTTFNAEWKDLAETEKKVLDEDAKRLDGEITKLNGKIDEYVSSTGP